MIVSVSRRCDIPFHSFNWFMARLDAGFCEAVNPFNARQVRRVSLKPANIEPNGVDAFVFWTRNPKHILENAEKIGKMGFHYYVMVTVTNYSQILEPSMTKAGKVCHSMKELAKITGPERVIWRYDPIFVSNISDEEFHRKNFAELAEKLSGSVQRVIISLYQDYTRSSRRIDCLKRNGVQIMPHNAAALSGLLVDLAQIAKSANMEIQSCAQTESFEPYGIKGGACIDAELINRLWGYEFKGKDRNQRPNCLCCQSVDIGSYGSCTSGCVYCYAW